jgi:hypothetical protein
MDRPSTIFASYVLLFVALDFPWVRVIDHAVPREGWMGDAGILVLVLGWVTHALATAPARLYELPINFPSRAQLTGSEHLLSAQLAFAPVYALTGNAVLGANVVALLSYPLAALSMERLLRALGCVAATAWIDGETISQQVTIGAPAPGGYVLSLVLEQRGGPPFLGDARRRWPIIVR